KHAVAVTPASQGLHVFHRGKRRAATLVSFHHHSGDVVRFDATVGQTLQKEIERSIFRAETVWERHLHEAGIKIDDPVLQSRHAARGFRTVSNSSSKAPIAPAARWRRRSPACRAQRW